MNKLIVSTAQAPKAIGPYSQAIRTDNLLFISGQVPIDPATGQLVAGDIRAQTKRSLDNVRAILQSQGLAPQNIIKTTVFMTDLSQLAAMNEVYQQYFALEPPARSTVQVSRLPKDALVEIEAIAVFP